MESKIPEGFKMISMTDNMSKCLSMEHVPSKDKEALKQHLVGAIEHFKKERNKAKGDVAAFAVGIHDMIDESQNKSLDEDRGMIGKISCKKGCAHCCYLNVDITLDEAKLLIAVVGSVDWLKARLQSVYNVNNWAMQPVEQRKCLFLGKDDCCTVYEHRPSACRIHLVANPPADCDTINNKGKVTANLNLLDVETIASAAMNLCETGNMAAMLLKAIQL